MPNQRPTRQTSHDAFILGLVDQTEWLSRIMGEYEDRHDSPMDVPHYRAVRARYYEIEELINCTVIERRREIARRGAGVDDGS